MKLFIATCCIEHPPEGWEDSLHLVTSDTVEEAHDLVLESMPDTNIGQWTFKEVWDDSNGPWSACVVDNIANRDSLGYSKFLKKERTYRQA